VMYNASVSLVVGAEHFIMHFFSWFGPLSSTLNKCHAITIEWLCPPALWLVARFLLHSSCETAVLSAVIVTLCMKWLDVLQHLHEHWLSISDSGTTAGNSCLIHSNFLLLKALYSQDVLAWSIGFYAVDIWGLSPWPVSLPLKTSRFRQVSQSFWMKFPYRVYGIYGSHTRPHQEEVILLPEDG
jgi:hypothetical protein